MSEALYLLQQDCIRNGKRLDAARQLIYDILLDLENGNPIKDRYKQILATKKILEYK